MSEHDKAYIEKFQGKGDCEMKKCLVKLESLDDAFDIQYWEYVTTFDKIGWIKLWLEGREYTDNRIRYWLVRESSINWIEVIE